MLSLIFMLSMFGCGDKIEDTADGVVTREEDQVPDLNPDDQPWGYEPDMVLFHNVTVIGDGDIACFDDGDGSPYCGVYKIYLTVWEDWDGVGDQGSCEITHRVAPEYVIESTATEDLVGVGALAGWEMDATQSFVATSAMCDFIREETPAHSVLERFKTENLIWGITMPSEDMVTEYTKYGVDRRTSIRINFHKKRLTADQDLYVRVGDFVKYGNFFYEVVKLSEPTQLFGQVENRFEITATCIRAREGKFNAK